MSEKLYSTGVLVSLEKKTKINERDISMAHYSSQSVSLSVLAPLATRQAGRETGAARLRSHRHRPCRSESRTSGERAAQPATDGAVPGPSKAHPSCSALVVVRAAAPATAKQQLCGRRQPAGGAPPGRPPPCSSLTAGPPAHTAVSVPRRGAIHPSLVPPARPPHPRLPGARRASTSPSVRPPPAWRVRRAVTMSTYGSLPARCPELATPRASTTSTSLSRSPRRGCGRQ
jgi:hypothetical protein